MKCEKPNKFALSPAEVVKKFAVWFDCDFRAPVRLSSLK